MKWTVLTLHCITEVYRAYVSCGAQSETVEQLHENVGRMNNANIDSFYLTYGGKSPANYENITA